MRHWAAAALAMTWALAVQIFILVKMGINIERGASAGVIFFVALLFVVAYILKDRIKATVGSQIAHILPRWLDDRWTLLTWRRGDRPIARVAERMSFLTAEKLPREVEQQRLATHGDALDRLHNDDTLVYVRRVIVRPARATKGLQSFSGLNDILRINVARWCRTLASPWRKIKFLEADGGLRERKLPNRYPVDIVACVRVGGRVVHWTNGCMFLTQRGIERVDVAGSQHLSTFDVEEVDD